MRSPTLAGPHACCMVGLHVGNTKAVRCSRAPGAPRPILAPQRFFARRYSVGTVFACSTTRKTAARAGEDVEQRLYPRRSGTSSSKRKNASPSRGLSSSCLDCSTVSMASLGRCPAAGFIDRMTPRVEAGTWGQCRTAGYTTASKFHPVGSSRPSPAKPPLATPIKIP